MRWNEYRILTIITSTLLLKSSTFLQPSSTSQDHRSTSELNRLIEQQLEDIATSATSFYSEMKSSSERSRIFQNALLGGSNIFAMIWPLYCASQLSEDNKPRQERMREILWDIGAQGNIPVAMSMVGSPPIASKRERDADRDL
jgi:hypothetical protein